MATVDAQTRLQVHLVGSVPLNTAEEVFRTVSSSVGPALKRLPDGETGPRRLWIGMISEMLDRHPAFEVDPDEPHFAMRLWNGELHRELKRLRIKPGTDPRDIRFSTNYAGIAIESFAVFDRLQREGAIASDTKFMIAIPSPVAPTYNYITPSQRRAFLDIFSAHLFDEIRKIAAALPNDRIAIQWDVLQEILIWENYFIDRPANYREETLVILGAMGDAVPVPIELGYHLCYGSPKDEHLVQPKDTGIMVEMIHGIRNAVHRPIQFIHLPVPKPRTDTAFYEPLRKLALPPGTELLLGLVHLDDDEGNRARLAAARAVAKVDGVSTECGWGRGNAARVRRILEAHRKMI